ncbi:MAG: DUF1670 domain-containing protein [bacterium]|nr:DUF1670 domain-containing protein [bacterium]
MGVRQREKELLARLDCKSLDAQFVAETRDGLDCSPFEADAVLKVVREVYAPYFDAPEAALPPGKMTLVVVHADEPAGKRLSDCRKQTVCLSVHRGSQDDALLRRDGPAAFRRARIPDLCQEALSQDGLLTREDLACRVFFVATRTISRDLLFLRQSGVVVPLRGTVHDIGPVLSHRTEIVRLALEGCLTTEICRRLRHSPEAVANYLSTFTRCVQLQRRGMDVGEIAFLLRRGPTLIEGYLELLAESEADPNREYHLDELLRLGSCGWEKKPAAGAGGDDG